MVIILKPTPDHLLFLPFTRSNWKCIQTEKNPVILLFYKIGLNQSVSPNLAPFWLQIVTVVMHIHTHTNTHTHASNKSAKLIDFNFVHFARCIHGSRDRWIQ